MVEGGPITVSIVGGTGYAGGELLRLLLGHPHVRVGQVTSRQQAGRPIHAVHPNLRGVTGRPPLRFVAPEALEPCDLLFLALPHGEAQTRIAAFAALAPRLVDLSADFRLRDPALYRRWYGADHRAPDWLPRFVYGLPEVNRAAIQAARYVSGVGCNATATILALLPFVRAGLLDPTRPIVVDLKVGSSEGGSRPTPASHHPERSGVVRSYAPVGHRHTAEVIQALGLEEVHLSATAVEMVRGVLATAHLWVREPITERDLWRVYRECYAGEPFVRIVHERRGLYRHPEPKLLVGSNFCDVGFALAEDGRRVVALAALDNLVKGAAGTAVQAMNLMMGWPETTGLTFPGLHPV